MKKRICTRTSGTISNRIALSGGSLPSIGDKILNLFSKAELIGVVLVESAEGVLEHTDAQRYKLLTLIGAQVYNL